MAPSRGTPAKKQAAKPATIRIKSSGGVRHLYQDGVSVTVSGDPVEVPVAVGEAIIARGKAVKA